MPATEPRWVTLTEAETTSEIPHRTLRRWADLGFLPSKREGRRVWVDIDALTVLAAMLPKPRHQPLRRGLAGPMPPAGLTVSWPEVDLIRAALHDAAEMRAAMWAAKGAATDVDPDLDQAARYAMLGARFGLASDAAAPARMAAIGAALGREP